MEYLNTVIQWADKTQDVSTAFAHRALSYALLERYDESFADFEDALYLDPDNGGAVFFRGIVREEAAKHERSASEVEGIPFDSLGLTK